MHTDIGLHDLQPRQGPGEGGQWARIGAWGAGAGALPCTCDIGGINGLDMCCSGVVQHVVGKTCARRALTGPAQFFFKKINLHKTDLRRAPQQGARAVY